MKTEHILNISKFVFWLVFIGLLIKTGTIIVSVVRSLSESGVNTLNSNFTIDGYLLKDYTKWEFIKMGSLVVSILSLQSYLAYLVIKVATKGSIKFPFTDEIGDLINKASYIALSIGILTLIATHFQEYIIKEGILMPITPYAKEFLFLAGIIFIISKVFQRGIELQKENDLTI